MERVTGTGGIFFKARGPRALAAWYEEHLRICLGWETDALFKWEERGGTVSSGKPRSFMLRWFTLRSFTLRWFTLRWFTLRSFTLRWFTLRSLTLRSLTLRWSPRSVRRSARRAGG